jgi:hypothetical protein
MLSQSFAEYHAEFRRRMIELEFPRNSAKLCEKLCATLREIVIFHDVPGCKNWEETLRFILIYNFSALTLKLISKDISISQGK